MESVALVALPAALVYFAGNALLDQYVIRVSRLHLIVIRNDKFDERKRKVARMALGVAAVALLRLNLALAVLCLGLVALTFKRTIWRYVMHPDEFWALLKFKFMHAVPGIPSGLSPAQQYCYVKLTHVSRSFSAVILHLHPKLREAICVFYLVCRGLDTVEDDMKPKVADKVKELRVFYQHLGDPKWTLKGYGDVPHEIDLLERFDSVNQVFATFPASYQEVISDIAKIMGNGMADYLTKRVETLQEYDEYCYYVAGLVGEGLTRLFAASGLESASLWDQEGKRLSISMGLFLQKTNIIRDYLEDISAVNPRMFYPKAIWGKHVSALELLKEPAQRPAALRVLNEMVTNAFAHAEDVVLYLERLTEPSIFAFCAIPQTMAFATLALCYNNGRVFEGEVKIGKGEAVKLILSSNTLGQCLRHFQHYAQLVLSEIPATDPSSPQLRKALQALLKKIAAHPKLNS